MLYVKSSFYPSQNNLSKKGVKGVVIFLFMFFIFLNSNALSQVIQIDSIEKLQLIGNNAAYPINGQYMLTNDIDASETRNWNVGTGFRPIGTIANPFMGKFDGNGYKILNLYINRPSMNGVGIFGRIGTGGEVKNLGLDGCWIKGKEHVGGLVGINKGTVSNCYSTSSMVGFPPVDISSYIGGLVGTNDGGTILESFSTGSAYGASYVGGLVGFNNNGMISESYSVGDVGGVENYIGGFVGSNSGAIIDSYSTGSVIGNGDEGFVGGFVGSNGYCDDGGNCRGGTISGSYSTGDVYGAKSFIGGFAGSNGYCNDKGNCIGGTISYCYSTGGVTGDEDFVGGLVGSNGDGDCSEGKCYKGTILNSNSRGNVYGGKGFVGGLVGSNGYCNDSDGKCYGGGVISDSYSTGSVVGNGEGDEGNNVGGLAGSNFGYITGSHSTSNILGKGSFVGGLVGRNDFGTISDSYSVGLVAGNKNIVGGLVGRNSGLIAVTYSEGSVNGSDSSGKYSEDIGGLIGVNSYGGVISRSYSKCQVIGRKNVGGLVGSNDFGGTVSETYSVGSVIGRENAGGLIGINIRGTVKDSYWDMETSGMQNSAGGEGKTTSEMKQKTTYIEWDFVSFWDIIENIYYPFFREFNYRDIIPEIILLGENEITIECKSVFEDPGANAYDINDGDLTNQIQVSSDIYEEIIGDYIGDYNVVYSVTDSDGNTSTETRIVHVVDTVEPEITLLGSNIIVLDCKSIFNDPGVEARDICDDSIDVITSGSVNTDIVGEYTIKYEAKDASGNSAEVTRTVQVVDTKKPVITLLGANSMVLECNTEFRDPGATVVDNCDSSISVTSTGNVGNYTITYTATDTSGNIAVPVKRTVQVVDTKKPTITLLGDNPMIVECKSTFLDPGVTAVDSCDSSVEVKTIGSVNANIVGGYTLKYAAKDASGNSAEVTRTVQVVDTTPPVIILRYTDIGIEKGGTFEDPGAVAVDACDGGEEQDLVAAAIYNAKTMEEVERIDTNTAGNKYIVRYIAEDNEGNESSADMLVRIIDETVPAVVGVSEQDAISIIEETGLKIKIERECNDYVREDYVIRQTPIAHSETNSETEVTIWVSTGTCNEEVIVPDAIGFDEDSAIDMLEDVGLLVSKTEQYSETVSAGIVIGQSPVPGSSAIRGTTVEIVVSKGSPSAGAKIFHPEGLKAYSGIDHIYLVWRANTEHNLTGYRLERSETGSEDWKPVSNDIISGTSYKDTDMALQKMWYYRVIAVGQGGEESKPSEVVSAEAGTLQVWTSNIDWFPQDNNDTLYMPINISSVQGLSPYTINIEASYNASILELMEIQKTTVSQNFYVIIDTNTPGVIKFHASPANNTQENILYGMGHLFDLVFKVNQSRVADECVQNAKLKLEKVVIKNTSQEVLPVTIINGKLNVMEEEPDNTCINTHCLYGDLDGDGNVTMADVVTLLNKIVSVSNMDLDCDLMRGDFNGDRLLDSADAILLIHKYSGLPVNPISNSILSKSLLATNVMRSVEVVVDNQTPNENNEYSIGIELNSLSGITGIDLLLSYDEGIAFSGLEFGDVTSNFKKGTAVGEGYLKVSISNENAINTTDKGRILNVFFQPENVRVPKTVNIVIREIKIKGEFGDDISWYGNIRINNATLTLIPMEGEVDGEGTIEGVIEGEGTNEGFQEGAIEGHQEGSSEGVQEGTAEGHYEGTVDGVHEGAIDGTPEGTVDGEGESHGEGGCGCFNGKASSDKLMKYLLDFIFVGFLISLISGMKRHNK